MKKNWFKIILDIIMAIMLFSMYNKKTVSMEYHEIGGLFLIGLFIIHNVVNWSWIKNISLRLTDKKLPLRSKICWIINFLLFVSFILIAISGIFISKTVFINITGDIILWKSIHYFVSALAIILIGIHIGLHWNYLKGFVIKKFKLPAKIGKILGAALIVFLLVTGVYNTINSDFSHWIATPFEDNIKEGKGLRRGLNAGLEEEALDPGKFSDIVLTYGSITLLFAILTKESEKRIISFKK